MPNCKHENFRADVMVNRLEDSGAFVADIKIKCTDCEEPFTFPPLPMGLDCSEARINMDGTELRLPLKPKSRSAFNSFVTFGVKRTM
jgi:hypothetical protein